MRVRKWGLGVLVTSKGRLLWKIHKRAWEVLKRGDLLFLPSGITGGFAKIQNPDIPSRNPSKSAFLNKHPLQVILTQVPPRTHFEGVAIEEVEVASCSQRLEVSGAHGNPLGGSGRPGRFLGEDAEAG